MHSLFCQQRFIVHGDDGIPIVHRGRLIQHNRRRCHHLVGQHIVILLCQILVAVNRPDGIHLSVCQGRLHFLFAGITGFLHLHAQLLFHRIGKHPQNTADAAVCGFGGIGQVVVQHTDAQDIIVRGQPFLLALHQLQGTVGLAVVFPGKCTVIVEFIFLQFPLGPVQFHKQVMTLFGNTEIILTGTDIHQRHVAVGDGKIRGDNRLHLVPVQSLHQGAVAVIGDNLCLNPILIQPFLQ